MQAVLSKEWLQLRIVTLGSYEDLVTSTFSGICSKANKQKKAKERIREAEQTNMAKTTSKMTLSQPRSGCKISPNISRRQSPCCELI